MRIAILGGSFNPVHVGHLALADDVCKQCGYDKILFVPALNPPHKTMNMEVSAKKRIKMLRFAIKGNKHFAVEDCEIRRGGISYTIDTVLYLQKKYKKVLEGKIGLIMGQEIASEFYKWNQAEKLSSITDIIIAHRFCAKSAEDEKSFENKPKGLYTGNENSDAVFENFKYPHINLKNAILPISSKEIRERVSHNESFRYLVSNDVFQYIYNHNLYK